MANYSDLDSSTRDFIRVPVPDVAARLPKPLVPSERDYDRVMAEERLLVRALGIPAGKYTTHADAGQYLSLVRHHTAQAVEAELGRFDPVKLIVGLYEQLERLYGRFDLYRNQVAAEAVLKTRLGRASEIYEGWLSQSQVTLALRWLIEHVVIGERSGFVPPADGDLRRLTARAVRIGLLDQGIEVLRCRMIPYTVSVSSDGHLDPKLADSSLAALEKWKKAATPASFEKMRNDVAGFEDILGEPITMDDLKPTPIWRHLDEPMRLEVGYGVPELLEFVRGVVPLIEEKGTIRTFRLSRFVGAITACTGLSEELVRRLLADWSLLPNLLANVQDEGQSEFRRFWRDTRLTRRPIVQCPHTGDDAVLVVGVETMTGAIRVFEERLSSGFGSMARIKLDGPVSRALGSMTEKAGNPFRDEIVQRCRGLGFVAIPEKDTIGGIGRPSGVGRPDVLVLDKNRARFVIVSAKALDVKTTPKEFDTQRTQFFGWPKSSKGGFLGELKVMVDWFTSLVSSLKKEYGLDADVPASVEGAVVVTHPMKWLFFETTRLPVLDFHQFLSNLVSGSPLLSDAFEQ